MNPLIFISHSHHDAELANMLVDCLMNGFQLKSNEVVCSSNVDYDISNNETILEDIRNKIINSKILIGLISVKGLVSPWVMFEIGIAWGQHREVIPILGNGITLNEKRLGPISAMNCWSTSIEKSFLRLQNRIKNVANLAGIEFKDSTYFDRQLIVFIETLNNWGNIHADFSQIILDVEIDGLHEDQTINKNFYVKVKATNFPQDGYLWTAVIPNKKESFYLKEPIQNDLAYISENGNPDAGEFKILIIGVGKSGNEKLKNIYNKIQASGGHTKERIIDTIPGGIILKEIKGLTVISNR